MNDTELEARGSDTAAADAETKRSNGAKRARLLGMIGLASAQVGWSAERTP